MLGPERPDRATGVTQSENVRAQAAVSWQIFIFLISDFTFLLYLDGSSIRHSRQFALLICDSPPCFEVKTLQKYNFLLLLKLFEIIVITGILFVSNEQADPHNEVDQDEDIMESRQQVPGDGDTLGREGGERVRLIVIFPLTLSRYIG